jgi:hypothetical protein
MPTVEGGNLTLSGIGARSDGIMRSPQVRSLPGRKFFLEFHRAGFEQGFGRQIAVARRPGTGGRHSRRLGSPNIVVPYGDEGGAKK